MCIRHIDVTVFPVEIIRNAAEFYERCFHLLHYSLFIFIIPATILYINLFCWHYSHWRCAAITITKTSKNLCATNMNSFSNMSYDIQKQKELHSLTCVSRKYIYFQFRLYWLQCWNVQCSFIRFSNLKAYKMKVIGTHASWMQLSILLTSKWTIMQ